MSEAITCEGNSNVDSYRTTATNCDSKGRPEVELSDELLLPAQGSNVVLIISIQGRLNLAQMVLVNLTVAAAAMAMSCCVCHLEGSCQLPV